MVLQRLLPSEGGPLRRFLSLRQRLYRDSFNDDRPARGPLSLFDFRSADDAADVRSSIGATRRGIWAGWRVSDDGVIGGCSTSNMELVTEKNMPFLRWSGRLSTEINRSNPKARHITRSGFAAIMTPDYPLGCPLGNGYRALEICCRTDGRTYAVNLHVETYFPDDMYQGFIGKDGMVRIRVDNNDSKSNHSLIDNQDVEEDETIEEPNQSLDVREYIQHRYRRMHKVDRTANPVTGFPPEGFARLILPFTDFTLTSKGRVRQEQRELDGAITIESIGFTLV